MQANLSFLQAEEATALNCSKAWASLRRFESFYPDMNFGAELNEQYSNSRAQCLALCKAAAEASGLNEGIALDAILLLDRLMHHSQETFSEVHKLCLCLSLLSAFCLDMNCLSIQLRNAVSLMQLAKRAHPGSCLACSSLPLPECLDGVWNAQACMQQPLSHHLHASSILSSCLVLLYVNGMDAGCYTGSAHVHGHTTCNHKHAFCHMLRMCTAHCCCVCHAMLQQVWLMQAAIPQLIGSCLVLATRHGLDLPQPVLDLPVLADFVNVPTGQCS